MYDPEADTWSPISTMGAPKARQGHTAVWTGKEMVVWGGVSSGQVQGSGGMYDPAGDAWVSVSANGAPKGRLHHGAAWTGSKMIAWGGTDYIDWFQSGGVFDPAGNTWTGSVSVDGAPTRREGHTAVWASGLNQLVIWGGWTGGPYENTGGLWSEGGNWAAMAIEGAPSPRAEHVGLWAKGELLVWGGRGEDSCKAVYGNGGRYRPGAGGGSWTAIEEQGALSARQGATGVFTGSSVIVWGGRDGSGALLDSGAESGI